MDDSSPPTTTVKSMVNPELVIELMGDTSPLQMPDKSNIVDLLDSKMEEEPLEEEQVAAEDKVQLDDTPLDAPAKLGMDPNPRPWVDNKAQKQHSSVGRKGKEVLLNHFNIAKETLEHVIQAGAREGFKPTRKRGGKPPI